jgi:hypothetical protein
MFAFLFRDQNIRLLWARANRYSRKTHTHTDFCNYRYEGLYIFNWIMRRYRLSMNAICRPLRVITSSLACTVYKSRKVCWFWGSHGSNYEEWLNLQSWERISSRMKCPSGSVILYIFSPCLTNAYNLISSWSTRSERTQMIQITMHVELNLRDWCRIQFWMRLMTTHASEITTGSFLTLLLNK